MAIAHDRKGSAVYTEERRREDLRALCRYRGMMRDHHWAAGALAALLSVGTATSARTCLVCLGRGFVCSWPPVTCGVCGGLGIEIQGGSK